MIKFQGRSSLKQYMPKKPIKRGIKVWVLGDSSNGYFSQLEVYTGKKGNSVEKEGWWKNLPRTFSRSGTGCTLTTFSLWSPSFAIWRALGYMGSEQPGLTGCSTEECEAEVKVGNEQMWCDLGKGTTSRKKWLLANSYFSQLWIILPKILFLDQRKLWSFP